MFIIFHPYKYGKKSSIRPGTFTTSWKIARFWRFWVWILVTWSLDFSKFALEYKWNNKISWMREKIVFLKKKYRLFDKT